MARQTLEEAFATRRSGLWDLVERSFRYIRRLAYLKPTMVAGIVVILVLAIISLAAPLLTSDSPRAIFMDDRLISPGA